MKIRKVYGDSLVCTYYDILQADNARPTFDAYNGLCIYKYISSYIYIRGKIYDPRRIAIYISKLIL